MVWFGLKEFLLLRVFSMLNVKIQNYLHLSVRTRICYVIIMYLNDFKTQKLICIELNKLINIYEYQSYYDYIHDWSFIVNIFEITSTYTFIIVLVCNSIEVQIPP